MMDAGSRRSRTGFTLVEMSVVLVVIAGITAMGVTAGMEAIESARRVSTDKKLDEIEKALLAFRGRYERLPCPGDAALAASNSNFGYEAQNNNGTCTGGTPAATYVTSAATGAVPSGAVPVRTLGLPDEFMVDGWGRKFMYEVTPAMTRDDAFLDSQMFDSCAISVTNHAGGTLPLNPVYALVSHGKNGIGGYINTTRQTGTAGTNEQTNIRTITTTPTIRVLNDNGTGTMGAAGYYDDLVRYKMRYQLANEEERAQPVNRRPDFALLYNTTSGQQLLLGKRQCGEFKQMNLTLPAAVGFTPRYLSFTPDNDNLLMYFAGNCRLYEITNTAINAVSAGTPVPNCPSGTLRGGTSNKNGFMALNDSSTPYFYFYSLMGSGSGAYYSRVWNPIMPTVSSAPSSITFSNDAEWMALARPSTYSSIYVKKGDEYQAIASLAGDSYTEYSNAISPNGRYYAISVVSGGNTLIYMWRNVGGKFQQITSGGVPLLSTITGMTTPTIMNFSADSHYLVVGGGSTGNKIVAYYVDPIAETLTSALTATYGTTPGAASFTSDGRYLLVSRTDTGANTMSIYRRTGATTFAAETLTNRFSFNASANSAFLNTAY